LQWIARIKPKRAILTDLHSDMDYGTLCRTLPEHIVPAFDGMNFEA
jgi:phosphoribosyl 1,2-cyclic phosphate phosphodiesterase